MRYIRQEVLQQIGTENQKKLLKSKVAIIGVGALGTVACELLLRAGVLNLTLVDKDEVDLVNLQRQLFHLDHVSLKKVEAMKSKLLEINKDAKISIHPKYLNEQDQELFETVDLILDCTDNMRSRHIINELCKKNNKIWIYAAGSGVLGNILVVDNYDKFTKIFNTYESFDSCSEIGVINTLTFMIASLQVTEAIKILTNQEHCSDLIRFNVWENEYKKIKY